MAYPSLLVEVAWASAPLATSPAYTDVTDYVVSVDTKRGRQYETDAIEAGTATIVFDNSDARFTPERATLADGSANPYYPNVDKNKLVRVSVTWLGTTYRLFTGFIESFATKGGSSSYGEMTVTCVDLFKFLGLKELSTGYKDTILADNPVAYYPLDETNGGTSVGSIATTPQAALVATGSPSGVGGGSVSTGDPSGLPSDNQALSLNSSLTSSSGDDFLGYLMSGAAPNVTGNTYTIEIWAKAAPSLVSIMPTRYTAPAIPVPMVYFWDGAGMSAGMGLAMVSGQLIMITGGRLGARGFVMSPTQVDFTDGKLHHVVVASDATSIIGYVDGVQAFSSSLPWTIGPSSKLLLGGTPTPDATAAAPGPLFRGTLAHAAVYPTKLTPTKIANHYAKGMVGFDGENEAARIGRYLGYLNSPYTVTGDAAVTTLSQVAATSDALAAIQEAASSAGGIVFVNGAGNLTYRNRNARAATSSSATFADSAGTSVDADPTFTFDETHVMDDVTITRSGGSAQRAVSVSQPLHPTSISTDVRTDDEALAQAQWLSNLYQTAHTRCDAVTISPTAQSSGALWGLVLPREIGDRITIGDLPAYAPATSMDFFIEQVAYSIQPNGQTPEWKASFQLSPTAYADTIFVLDSPTHGVLDSNRLYY